MKTIKGPWLIAAGVGIFCVALLVGGFVAFFLLKTPMSVPATQQSSVEEDQTLEPGHEGPITLVMFLSPKGGENISGKTDSILTWSVPPEVQSKFKDFWMTIDLVDHNGNRIGSIGDGFRLNETSTTWALPYYINGGFYPEIKEGEKYHLEAALQIDGSLTIGCDPFKSSHKDCVPLYPPALQELIPEAQKYKSQSDEFIITDL
jgi:hypothetical protein